MEKVDRPLGPVVVDIAGTSLTDEEVKILQNPMVGMVILFTRNYENREQLHNLTHDIHSSTVFPITMGMASTFDDKLVEDVFTVVSDEARAKYHNAHREGRRGVRCEGLTFWTPNVNIFRDPRWGRGQETYGEDPYLTSRMGVAVVNGLQGPADAKYDKLHACAKHYAVHSGPEAKRHYFNAENISPRDLWETYLPAFKDLVQEADVKEVMCAYNRFEGDPCCGSNRLLTQILRDEWGYKHMVVSDCGAISDFFYSSVEPTFSGITPPLLFPHACLPIYQRSLFIPPTKSSKIVFCRSSSTPESKTGAFDTSGSAASLAVQPAKAEPQSAIAAAVTAAATGLVDFFILSKDITKFVPPAFFYIISHVFQNVNTFFNFVKKFFYSHNIFIFSFATLYFLYFL